MLANTKRLKMKMNALHLPWWFNLIESGIPYLLAANTSIVIMLTLGGWLDMPESVQLLKWVEALFLAMSPSVKFLAVSSIGLGSFLSTFAIVSVFVCGLLYNYVKKPALDGLAVSEELLEQTKELQQAILKQSELNELFKQQVEFLKGYAKALKTKIEDQEEIALPAHKKRCQTAPEFDLELEQSQDTQQEPQDENLEELEQEQDDLLNKEWMPNPEDLEGASESNAKISASQEPEIPKHPAPVVFSTHRPASKHAQSNSRVGRHHHHCRKFLGTPTSPVSKKKIHKLR